MPSPILSIARVRWTDRAQPVKTAPYANRAKEQNLKRPHTTKAAGLAYSSLDAPACSDLLRATFGSLTWGRTERNPMWLVVFAGL